MKNFISALYIGQCVLGNQVSEGALIVDELLKHIPEDKLQDVCKEVIEICKVDSEQLKIMINSVTSETSMGDSSDVEANQVVNHVILQDIIEYNRPLGEVNSFVKLAEQAEISSFFKRMGKTGLRKMCEYALSIAEFDENCQVTQTSGIEESNSDGEFRADHTLYWYNNANEELAEDEDPADDLMGRFYVCISPEGLSINAGIDGEDVTIENINEVLELVAEEFNIPKSLLS